MDDAQNQLIEKIHDANNILVTVSRNPSVDQLAACLGLTLLINKLNKHGTAVFSGKVPSTIEFLQPEQTIEKNTDSLRDFIIALDKSKADKLRYKVEDQMVRIFITPYRTSISDKDLEFSQGDFNVDMVIALGVTHQEDVDEAITAHGRILHDAIVTSINIALEGGLGTINWHEPAASSLSELVAHLARNFGQNLLDEQIATALLTGIVSETKRFSNEKTTAQTMSVSAELMAAGANQQLVATKLEEPAAPAATAPPAKDDLTDDFNDDLNDQPDLPAEPPKPDDGTLEIEHTPEESRHKARPQTEEASPEPVLPENTENTDPKDAESQDKAVSDASPEPTGGDNDNTSVPPLEEEAAVAAAELPKNAPSEATEADQSTDQPPAGAPPEVVEPEIANQPEAGAEDTIGSQPKLVDTKRKTPKLVTEPPQLGGRLTANSQPEPLEPSSDPMSLPAIESRPPLLDRSSGAASSTSDPVAPTPLTRKGPDPILPGFTPPPPAWVPPSDDALDFVANNPLPAGTDKSTVAGQDSAATDQPTEDSDSTPTPTVDYARDEVMQALNSNAPTAEPLQALNAQPLGDTLHAVDSTPVQQPSPSFVDTLQQTIPSVPAPAAFVPPAPVTDSSLQLSQESAISAQTPPSVITPLPSASLASASPAASQPSKVIDENAAPPVPPPIPFHFGNIPQPPQS